MYDIVYEYQDKNIYTYDLQNNMTSHLYQIWESGKMVNQKKYEYSYDENNNAIEGFFQKWENNTWIDANTSYYFYYESPVLMFYNNKQSKFQRDGCHRIAISYIKTGTVSIQENSTTENAIKLYPNPVSNILHIEVENSNTIPEIKLYSIQGVLLINTKGNQIDVSSLSNGIYIAEIDGVCRKIVKQ
jgi:hypothetical protein